MRYGVAVLVFCVVAGGVLTMRSAVAVKPFMEQFKALYVKPKTSDHNMQIFNVAVEKKGCTICHGGQANKPKGYNAYGKQLKQLLTKQDAANPRKVQDAMKQVAGMKSNPLDPSSSTFGKRLHEGKLPVGEIHVRSKESQADN